MPIETTAANLGAELRAVLANVERVIRGKRPAIRMALVCLLAEGHLLLEDAPGTGKTSLARAMARSLAIDFKRVQFTSDLLPADLLGVSVYSQVDDAFVFRRGPIFGNVVLADEINRTTPRTQSALLECMEERSVSIDGETQALARPFLVIATQNPLEFEGTYPLPESQLDRFLMRLRLGYPDRAVERELLTDRLAGDPFDSLAPVLERERLLAAIEAAREVKVTDELLDYALDVVERTRNDGDFLLGASPRATLGWVRAARAFALLHGRDYCVPDDFKLLALPTLAHRVVAAMGSDDDWEGDAAERLLRRVLGEVDVPA